MQANKRRVPPEKKEKQDYTSPCLSQAAKRPMARKMEK